ncbi:fumarate hydratase [Methanococcus maripaludis]|uniref:Fumarate hydratase n=3 Tax=Methanococcus maripaludis TaxID=39152 RepID=Q6M0Y8_METMP|nr:fumarate hydratase [Methanococcus maripaludis]AEK19022.1 fumarate hydratase [Methanococcus maripaludis X1]BAP62247.1 putative Fe-S type hydro-lyases alpha subunit [Methanococcus maripaludis OS7]CAF29686.1 fumarate hydratase [Methanococcus maripaludis S2]
MSNISEIVVELFKEASIYLPDDVKSKLKHAEEVECGACKDTLQAIELNNKIAETKQIPLCQDTGVPVIFLKIGTGISSERIIEIIKEIESGVKRATAEVPLRPNVVNPITRENLGTNTGMGAPFINFEFSENLNNEIEISVFPKGAGSENMSALKMLTPSEGLMGIKKFILETVANAGGKPCPPIVLGIGIGGTADISLKLAKKALLRDIGNRNPEKTIENLEKELLDSINQLGIGTMGLGGKITALDVFIEVNGCHTASLPVGICIQCWADRKAKRKIKL